MGYHYVTNENTTHCPRLQRRQNHPRIIGVTFPFDSIIYKWRISMYDDEQITPIMNEFKNG